MYRRNLRERTKYYSRINKMWIDFWHSALCCDQTECIFTFIDLHLYQNLHYCTSRENSNRKTKHTWQAATSCTNIWCNHLTDFILTFKFYKVIRQNQHNKNFSLPHYYIYSINSDEQTRNIEWHIIWAQWSLWEAVETYPHNIYLVIKSR